MRLSEAASAKAQDFNWEEGTVVVLGKGNRYRKALAGNGVVKNWFTKHDDLGITSREIRTMLQRLGQSAVGVFFTKLADDYGVGNIRSQADHSGVVAMFGQGIAKSHSGGNHLHLHIFSSIPEVVT